MGVDVCWMTVLEVLTRQRHSFSFYLFNEEGGGVCSLRTTRVVFCA